MFCFNNNLTTTTKKTLNETILDNITENRIKIQYIDRIGE